MGTNESSDQMPQTIGRYQVQESIGFGAMGAVYKAFDPLIKRTLAIKTIRLDIPRQSPQYKSFIDRFYHEARISGTLSHPNIVTLFDIGEEGGLPYLAMEYVEGETIAGILEKGQRFKPEKVIGLVSQIAAAVDYAHGKGVIHRDIKPSNLILHEGDKVKVTDFGIAKLIDAEMTQSGTLLGTPSYMSPEQAMGEKLDGRSDIFALGVCAFEMLSGEQPFPGNNVTSILYKLVHVDPIEPANLEMNGLVPEKWHQVFGKVLAKKPDDRYQTATEFVQDLEYCLGAWFGSAVGDLGSAEPLAAEAPGLALDQQPTKAMPVLEEPEAATLGMPAVVAGAQPSDTLPPTVLGALLPGGEAEPAGIPFEAPAAAGEGTVLMTAPTGNLAPSADATVLTTAPPPEAPPAEGTVLMAVPAPAAEAEGTVLMSPVAAAPREEATFLMAAPGLPGAAGEGTVLMAVPPPVSAAGEGTVLMSSPGLAGSPAAEGTVVMAQQPELPRRAAAGSLPITGPLPRAEPVPAPGQKKSPALLLLGAAGLVLVLGLAGGLVYFLRHRERVEPTPPPPPVPVTIATPTPAPADVPPAATRGSLRVESTPSGATASLDGAAQGATPLEMNDLTLGDHEIKVEMRGYEAATQSVNLTPEAPQASVNLTLTRVAPVTGSLEVSSVPPGASVSLNGAAAGQTPYRHRALRPGVYRVQVAREGYETWVQDATLEAGKRARLEAVLKALPKATPTPEPKDTVDPSKVYMPNEVDVLPKKVAGSTPSYPSDAPKIRSGEKVSVIVSFVVTDSGEVADVKIVESGGKQLDEALLGSVRAWRYTPGTKKGVKVKVRMSSKLTFM